MADILDRLRAPGAGDPTGYDRERAANEIERLRAEVATLRNERETATDALERAALHFERIGPDQAPVFNAIRALKRSRT